MSVMINQRDFSGAFAGKINQLLDSVNTLVSTHKVAWTTINEKFDTFQVWSATTGNTYSQWECVQTPLALTNVTLAHATAVYPNPCNNELMIDDAPHLNFAILNITGQTAQQGMIKDTHAVLNIADLPAGFYLINLSGETGMERRSFIKQ